MMSDFLDAVRKACDDEDIEVVTDYPDLYIVDDVSGTPVLTLRAVGGLTQVIEGDVKYYGITSEVLEFINWPPFNIDETLLEVDEEGDPYYPDVF